jgi:hypothetical protein
MGDQLGTVTGELIEDGFGVLLEMKTHVDLLQNSH